VLELDQIEEVAVWFELDQQVDIAVGGLLAAYEPNTRTRRTPWRRAISSNISLSTGVAI
jgi:hypothetical protein